MFCALLLCQQLLVSCVPSPFELFFAVPQFANITDVGVCEFLPALPAVFVCPMLHHVVVRLKLLLAICALDHFLWVLHIWVTFRIAAFTPSDANIKHFDGSVLCYTASVTKRGACECQVCAHHLRRTRSPLHRNLPLATDSKKCLGNCGRSVCFFRCLPARAQHWGVSGITSLLGTLDLHRRALLGFALATHTVAHTPSSLHFNSCGHPEDVPRTCCTALHMSNLEHSGHMSKIAHTPLQIWVENLATSAWSPKGSKNLMSARVKRHGDTATPRRATSSRERKRRLGCRRVSIPLE